MSAVGLQIIATMNLEESTIGKWVIGASRYAAFCAGAMPHDHNIHIKFVEERFGIFYLEPLPPSVGPPLLKMHRCMVCRKRLEKQDIFMSRGIAFCSPECRSSDEARKIRQKAMARMAPTSIFQQREAHLAKR